MKLEVNCAICGKKLDSQDEKSIYCEYTNEFYCGEECGNKAT